MDNPISFQRVKAEAHRLFTDFPMPCFFAFALAVALIYMIIAENMDGAVIYYFTAAYLLLSAAAEVLGLEEFDEAVFSEVVEGITAAEGNTLIFRFTDGTEQTAVWADRSRSESWTPEMKAAAAERTRQRSAKKCQGQ